MMRDERLTDEPFRQWMKREWLLVVITVGIGIDSFLFLLTGYFPQLAPLSGTRFVVHSRTGARVPAETLLAHETPRHRALPISSLS